VRMRLLSLALVALLAGCGSAARAAKPTEAETRDAYFNTPVITDDSGGAVKLGITRSALFRLFEGRAAIAYRRGARECVVYPILGTQRWDAHDVPVAAEWEFCFGDDDKLVAKRRLPIGS
jgi:uncharacterized protein YceK